jgi:hypothetical protein
VQIAWSGEGKGMEMILRSLNEEYTDATVVRWRCVELARTIG